MSVVESTRFATSPIFERFKYEERLCINYTLRCNIQCRHCNVSSSPYRTEALTLSEALGVVRTGADAGKRHLTLSGGEVFLYYDDLLEIVGRAHQLSYEVDVETNAFFARTPEKALAQLKPLVAAGLSGICLSCDAFHLEFFELDRSIRAAFAALELGLLVEVNFCPSDQPDTDRFIVNRLREVGIPFLENPLLNRGRARNVAAIASPKTIEELPLCDSLNATVHATGEMYACCELEADTEALKQTPVYLGDIKSPDATTAQAPYREALVRAFHDPDSPAFFRKLCEEEPSFEPLLNRTYASICDFCVDALKNPARVEAIASRLSEHR